MMLNSFGCGGALDATPNINKFESKAEALKFAIEFTAKNTENYERVPNLPTAQELFDFICKNVELPDTQLSQWGDVIANANSVVEMVRLHLEQYLANQKADKEDKG